MADTAQPTVKLIDYYADWCGPCRAMEPVLEELQQEFAGKVVFEKVNVDAEQDKANAAGVMSLPTFHVTKDDKVIQTLIGYQSKDEMAKQLTAALGTLS